MAAMVAPNVIGPHPENPKSERVGTRSIAGESSSDERSVAE